MGDFIKSTTILKTIIKEWNQIPVVVRQFVVRALLLLVFWFVAYTCILKPSAGLDNWLTKITAQATTAGLNRFYNNGFVTEPMVSEIEGIKGVVTQYISLQNKFAVYIVPRCNGLELFAAYIGFLVCVPGTIKKKFAFVIFGVVLIYLVNVLRCCILAWLNLNKPEWSEFAHHYAFTTIVYVFIFMLWVLFMKKTKTSEA